MADGATPKKKKVDTKSGFGGKIKKSKIKIDRLFPGVNYQQYVNMDQGTNTSRHGRQITVSARVKPHKASITIEWMLDTPGAPNTNRAGLLPAERAFLSGVSSMTNDKGVAEITLTLSTYGGDKFRVAARIAGMNKYKYSGWFSVWKKLYFDIVEMEKDKSGKYEMPPDVLNCGKFEMPLDVLNRIKSGFSKSFIELKDTGIRHLGDYKDNFDEVEKGFKWADNYCSNNGVPQKIHFCVIDRALPRTGPYGAQTKVVFEDADTVEYISSGKIRSYDFSGHNWLIKAEYESLTFGVLGNLKKIWKEFSAGKVTMIGKRGIRSFKVDFKGTERSPTAANKVKVKITYLSPGSYGGWGGENCLHLLICRGEYLDITTLANTNDQIIVAGMHEPGHAIGLVDASAAWHDAAHQAHCIHNTCTMWFESKAGNEAFHSETISDPGCNTSVRGADLTKKALQLKWKFPR